MSTQQDVTSFKELITLIIDYTKHVLKFWWVVLFTVVVVGLLGYAYAVFQPVSYTATLSFMVDEEKGGSIGSVDAILGQVGLGSGASGGKYNLDRITTLGKSRNIIYSALFDSCYINDKRNSIANFILTIGDYHEDWQGDSILRDFYFDSDSAHLSNRYTDNLVLGSIYSNLVGSTKVRGQVSLDYDKNTRIFSYSTEQRIQELSVELVGALYKELERFYVNQATKQQRITLENLQNRADSIRSVVLDLESEMAIGMDRSLNMPLTRNSLNLTRSRRELQIASVIYAEVVKNTEITRFSLENSSPVFQVIDKPRMPITQNRAPKYKFLIIGVMIGLFLSTSLIVLNKLIKDLLK